MPASLRTWLTNNGFEVGVHDLNHDGHLFSSQESFQRKAQRINSYLAKWNAVGFRSAYMLRNLEWIQKIHRDKATRGYSAEAVMDTILRRMPDYVRYITPQFSRTALCSSRMPPY